MRKSEPELPILPSLDFHPPSNGEFCPTPPPALARRRWDLWRRIVEEKHRRLGITRREFASSACGTAATMFVMNQLGCDTSGTAADRMPGGGDAGVSDGNLDARSDQGVTGKDASGFDVDPDMTEDMAKARERLMHDTFVFDVQTHISTNEITPWPERNPPQRVLDFLKRIFVQSQTTVACVSGVPATRALGIGNVQARAYLQELVEQIGGPRMRFHCNADPERAGEPDYMAEAFGKHKEIAAWKVYPQKPNHGLDHRDSEPFLERARALGVKLVAAHRGIRFSDGGGYNDPSSPLDVVRAAKKFPDLKFLVYHSGWEFDVNEDHAYDPAAADAQVRGVDRFIRALKTENIGQDGNVYAELGSTWANLIMRDRAGAAHVLGKLLKQLGPNRVLWGTDCVFNDGPQGQIDLLRGFTIAEQLQQQQMYPALTDATKRRILGLNAADLYGVDPAAVRNVIKNDDIDLLRMAYLHDERSVPMPHPRTYTGPRTRRQFLAFRERERAAGGHT